MKFTIESMRQGPLDLIQVTGQIEIYNPDAIIGPKRSYIAQQVLVTRDVLHGAMPGDTVDLIVAVNGRT